MKNGDKEFNLKELMLVSSSDEERDSEEDLFKEMVDAAHNSDAFVFIPMIIDNNGNGTFSVETSVQMHDRLNLKDGSSEVEAFYLSALGGLIGTCFSRLEPKAVIDYLTSLLQRIADMEKGQQRH